MAAACAPPPQLLSLTTSQRQATKVVRVRIEAATVWATLTRNGSRFVHVQRFQQGTQTQAPFRSSIGVRPYGQTLAVMLQARRVAPVCSRRGIPPPGGRAG